MAAAVAAAGSGPLEALANSVTGSVGVGSVGGANATLVASAALACFSVGLNLYGGLLTERKRADLQLELEREKNFASAQAREAELQSLLARYRGPLLESVIDLEQRLWHLACFPEEWGARPAQLAACDMVAASPALPVPAQCATDFAELCTDEVNYTAFCLAQFLGFVEVVRREGPRERSFLQRGSLGGSDVLSIFVEGVRFVLCASADSLSFWGDTPEAEREHPGARIRRRRRKYSDKGGHLAAPGGLLSMDSDDEEEAGVGGGGEGGGGGMPAANALAAAINGSTTTTTAVAVKPPPPSVAAGRRRRYASSSSEDDDAMADDVEVLRISRGAQRAIGSFMISTPMGAERHYTLSYGEFCHRLTADPEFAARLAPLRADIALLASGPRWTGAKPFPAGRWTRVVLLQQLLVEAMGLLDADGLRVPADRRAPLAGMTYVPLIPCAESVEYRRRLQALGDAVTSLDAGAALNDLKSFAMRGNGPSLPLLPDLLDGGRAGGAGKKTGVL